MIKRVQSDMNFVEREIEVVSFWQDRQGFKASVE